MTYRRFSCLYDQEPTSHLPAPAKGKCAQNRPRNVAIAQRRSIGNGCSLCELSENLSRSVVGLLERLGVASRSNKEVLLLPATDFQYRIHIRLRYLLSFCGHHGSMGNETVVFFRVFQCQSSSVQRCRAAKLCSVSLARGSLWAEARSVLIMTRAEF